MKQDKFKKVLEQKSIDPLLIAIAHKGYQWLIDDELTEGEAIKLQEYILNNTTAAELEELKAKKKTVRAINERNYK